MGAVPMDMLPESSQQQQEQNDELDTEMSPKNDDGDNDEELTTAVKENIIIPTKTQTKPINQMDCIELEEFAFSFEQGWGSAVALHDEKCS